MNFMREIGWLKTRQYHFIVEICKSCISLSINVIPMLDCAPRLEKHQAPSTNWEREAAGQQLGTWGLSALEKRRLKGHFFIFLKWGSGEGGAELVSLGSSDSKCGNSSKPPHQERLDWTLGSFSLPGRWSNTGTDFLERWLMAQACV